ncbi:hypothetical protein K402DRAFT_400815 [Aulographum hederae CBS 113979]|uniref:Uncharacterized protein n=1 Tax=Aulographum hederae CBS 113979 TaxID=1176131 RepID=A0A6G1HBL4_9PEZI|nr:hypothetical protein K402DRAFT_400815 [Aulographum hederae CBS 113979]
MRPTNRISLFTNSTDTIYHNAALQMNSVNPYFVLFSYSPYVFWLLVKDYHPTALVFPALHTVQVLILYVTPTDRPNARRVLSALLVAGFFLLQLQYNKSRWNHTHVPSGFELAAYIRDPTDFSISGVSGFIVSHENPSRSGNDLDFHRCAQLHNHVLHLGWIRSQGAAELNTTSWWDFYRDEAEAVRHRLTPSLISFLQEAQVHREPPEEFHLFSHLSYLNHPFALFQQHDDIPWELSQFANNGGDRYLTLYGNSYDGYNGDYSGLSFDQITHKAIQAWYCHDDAWDIQHDSPWQALEDILSSLLYKIDEGQMAALSSDPTTNHNEYPWFFHGPWAVQPWTEKGLDLTIVAFNRLVDEIETRALGSKLEDTLNDDHEEKGLYDTETLSTARLRPNSFLYRFLQGIRKPTNPKLYLAPGLRLPTPSEFLQQPHASDPWRTLCEYRAFDGTLISTDSACLTHTTPPIRLLIADCYNCDVTSPYHWPWDGRPDTKPGEQRYPIEFVRAPFPPGLYINPISTYDLPSYEDSFRLVLPFLLGEQNREFESMDSRGIRVDGGCGREGTVSGMVMGRFISVGMIRMGRGMMRDCLRCWGCGGGWLRMGSGKLVRRA